MAIAFFYLKKSFVRKAVMAGIAFAGLMSFRIPESQALEYYANNRELTIKQGLTGTARLEVNRDGARDPIQFTLTGGNGITATLDPNPQTNMAASYFTTVTFRVAATAPVSNTEQTVRLTARSGSASKTETFFIKVTRGTTGAQLAASASSVAFPATLVTQTVTSQSLTLRNSGSGTGTVDISGLSLSGADAASFAMNTNACQGARLAAGGSCVITFSAAPPAAARAYNASLAVTSNAGSLAVPLSLQGTDFLLSASAATLNPGGTATVTVTANRSVNAAAQATGAIVVTPSGLPAGVTASPVTIASGATSGAITLRAATTATNTTSPVAATYSGNLNGRVKTANGNVSVQPTGTFTLSASPSSVTITQGLTGGVTVNISRNNFTGSVTVAGLPASGITTNSATTTGNSASLTITVPAATPANTYPLQIRGQNATGTVTVNTGVSVIVRAAPADFTLALSSGSANLTPGATATNFNANLTRSNFTGNVTFAITGLPANVTASCDAITSGTVNTTPCRLSASADAVATPSPATVTVTATGGSITKTATMSVRVAGAEGLKAFPGAEGFGANVTGGRGGVVCKVTNVNASGAGSLQACLDLTQPAYVVFAIPAAANDAIIDRSIECHQGNKTIAGQTATRGIMVREFIADNVYENNMACRNYVIRHMKFRADAGLRAKSGEFYGDTVRLDGVRDFIFDHASIERSYDEAFQLSRATNITVQNSILAETFSDHYWGGMLINYSNQNADLNGLSIHHNMWSGIRARFPEITCEENRDGTPNYDGAGHLLPSNCTGKRLQIELSNNLIYDPSDPIYYNRCTDTNGGNDCAPSDPSFFVDMNFVGNYMKARTGFTNPMIVSNLASETRNDIYYGDNYLDVGIASLFNLAVTNLGGRFDYPEITYTPGNDVEEYMQANVGAFPRDAMDQRLVGYLSQNINSTPTATNEAGRGDDTFNLLPASCTGPLVGANDSDNDGMNDNWERRHGLNVGVADHNGTNLSSDGYTNIEVYLNELSDRVVAAGSSTSGVCD